MRSSQPTQCVQPPPLPTLIHEIGATGSTHAKAHTRITCCSVSKRLRAEVEGMRATTESARTKVTSENRAVAALQRELQERQARHLADVRRYEGEQAAAQVRGRHSTPLGHVDIGRG